MLDDDKLLQELRDNLKINKDALDTALIRLPVLHDKVSDLLSEAKRKHEALEADIKDFTSELDSKYRRSDSKETEIRRSILNNKKMQRLGRECLEAKTRVSRLSLLKESYEYKSRSLHDLVALHNANYFVVSSSGRSNDRNSDAEAERNRKEVGAMRRAKRDN